MITNPQPHLPPYNDTMGVLFKQIQYALMHHWKAHKNAYPQKLLLTPAQADDLVVCQLYGQVSNAGCEPPNREKYMGTVIEISDTTVGEIVAIDGTVTPLSEFTPQSPAKK